MPAPAPRLHPLGPEQVTLQASMFSHRWELNRQYLLELKAENLLQNHYFEAGIWGPPGKPGDDIHWGWESPNSLVRGHFLGHWMSAAAQIVATNGDVRLRGQLDFVVGELARVQEENGGEWVFSTPERYLHRIARGRSAWAAQYIVSKTFMGLNDVHKLLGDQRALEVAEKATPWFHRWAMGFTRDEFDDILDFETCGMLEVWADLYGFTGRQEYLDLMERYDRARLFDELVRGNDLLTNRHANTTIPEVLGAARAYEVTGEQRWRDIVEAYWRMAVTDRGFFATGGQTAAESWTPPFELSARLGINNQEHCTVYNMMRLAEYLLRWTGDVEYADYRERNLYNGVLAQQHPATGMVAYYLGFQPGVKKIWSERTSSFWCCVATLVQANALHGTGTYFTDDDGLVVAGYVPAKLTFEHGGTPVTVTVSDAAPTIPRAPGQENLVRDVGRERPNSSRWYLRVETSSTAAMSVRVRLPWWLTGPARASVGGEPVELAGGDGPSSWATVTRVWSNDVLELEFPHELVTVPLPDKPDTVALMEGPVVFAGLCEHERTLVGDPAHPRGTAVVPDNERNPTEFAMHYRAVGIDPGLRFVPLHEVTDEPYTIYFPMRQP